MNQENNQFEQNNFNEQDNIQTQENKMLENNSPNQKQNEQQIPILNQQNFNVESPLNTNQSQVSKESVNNFTKEANDIMKKNKKSKFSLIFFIIAVIVSLGIIILLTFNNFLNSNKNNLNKIKLDPILQTNENNKIENYEVDLKEFEFEADNIDLYINEIKGNILDVKDYIVYINNKGYDMLLLTKNGNLYLYKKYHDILKIEGKVKMKYINGAITQSSFTDDLYIYGDGYIYQLNNNGILTELDNYYNFIYLIKIEDDYMFGITSDAKLSYLLSCEKYDLENKSGKCSNKSNKIILKSDEKYKYADSSILIDEKGNIYNSYVSLVSKYVDYENLKLGTKNFVKIYENSKLGYSFGDLSNPKLLQFSNNNITISHNLSNYKIIFDEPVRKVYGMGLNDFLFKTDKSINYIYQNCQNNNCNYEINNKKIETLIKYKDKIKNFGAYLTDRYVLLTNGNLYEVYELRF